MEENSGIHINGFYYQDVEAGEIAKREEKAIEYLREQCFTATPENVLAIYDKLLDSGLFKTESGIVFLHQLRESLVADGSIDASFIKDIPISREISDDEKEKTLKKHDLEKQNNENALKRKDEIISKYKNRFRIAVLFSVICVAAIVAMFLILKSAKIPTIINYEDKILNKYSKWEQELKDREKAVREKENKLGIVYDDSKN